MRSYFSPEEIAEAPEAGRAVAIGVFDGVHRGHRVILERTVDRARATGASAAAITFYPHPDSILHPGAAPRMLTSLERKAALLDRLGLDELVVVKFDTEFARLSPEAFCRLVLSERLGARVVVVGENFRFGHGGGGTPEDLREFGATHGYEVSLAPLAYAGGEAISSTRIRRLVGAGHVAEAARLLGRPHRLEGPVVQGAGRGRSLSAPTANMAVGAGMALPAMGVYVTWCLVDGSPAGPSLTSLGTNPTFETGGKVHVETLLLEPLDGLRSPTGDLYGRHLEVDFLEWVRPQQTFPDAASLARWIRRDVEFARGYFRSLGATSASDVRFA